MRFELKNELDKSLTETDDYAMGFEKIKKMRQSCMNYPETVMRCKK